MVAVCNHEVFEGSELDVPVAHLRLAPAGASRRPHASVYRRRRLVAGLVAAVLAVLALGIVAPVLGDPATTSLQAGAVHVVRPGDTYWSIATLLDTDGDIRDTVAALAAGNGDRALQVGDRIQLPT